MGTDAISTDAISIELSAPTRPASLPTRTVDQNAPNRWLALAWQDFLAAPGLSMAWGGMFSLIGLTIGLGLQAIDLGSLIPFSIACFFLLAPLLSVGLYDVSRRLERGEPLSLSLTMMAWQRNPSGLSGLGLALLLAVLAWAQAALLLFILFFNAPPPDLEDSVHSLLTAPQSWAFLGCGMLLGGAIAALVFGLSAISLPLLLSRNISAERAMATSFQAVRRNAKVMTGWAATIVFLTGCGIVTAFAGLAITLPLVAYASRHACKDLVE